MERLFATLVCLAIALVGVYWLIRLRIKDDKAKREAVQEQQRKVEASKASFRRAQQEYQNALRLLKGDPFNPDKKEQALKLGREYARLMREGKQETIFDELALMNDINAATAAASERPTNPSPGAPPSNISAEDRLNKLEELRKKGLISDDEYRTRREKILDDL